MSDARDAAADDRLHVFLSYSRSDLTFARDLRDRLIHEGFDAYIDVEDIVKGEPWRERLGRLIAEADAVLFLMSPDSVASEICGWEVNEAERLGKRVLPVVARATPTEEIPGRLSRLNYTFLDTPERKEAEFAKLLAALRENADWIREHTRLGDIASRWRAAGAPSRLLLRGSDISDAELWRDGKPSAAPAPTHEHLAFIDASRRGATRRQRWWIGGASAIAAGAAGLAGVAIVQSVEARAQRDGALLTQSRFLADLAHEACDAGDAGGCLALALEAAPKPDLGDPRPYAPSVETAMLRGLTELRERRVLFAENAPLRTLALSPDGDWAATLVRTDHQTGRPAVPENGETSGRATVRSLATGAALRDLRDPDAEDPDALSLDVDPATGAVAVADRDGSVRIFDAADGALLKRVEAFEAPMLVARYAPDGGLLGVAGGVRAKIYETNGWTEVAELDHRVTGITNLAFGPENERVVVTTSDGYATVWRLTDAPAPPGPNAPAEATGAEIIDRVQGESGWARAAVLGDGARHGLLFANSDGGITSTAPPLRLDRHQGAVAALALSPEKDQLASAASDGTARLWDLTWLDFDTDAARALIGERSIALGGHDGAATAVAWTPDGGLVTAGEDGVARLWSGSTMLAPRRFGDREAFCVNAAGFALGGAAVATGCGDGTVRLWDPIDGGLIWSSASFSDVQPRIALSADGAYAIAAASRGGDTRVFDLAAQRLVAQFEATSDGRVEELALSPDGAVAATASSSGEVALWTVADGAEIARVSAHEKDIVSIAFSPDGAHVVTSALDGAAKIWSAVDAAPIAVVGTGDVVIWRVLFLAEGREALTITGDGDVTLWSTTTGALIRRFEGHRAAVKNAAIDPAEKRLVTLGFDGVRIWSIETGKTIAQFDAWRGDSAAFRPDGARLAIGRGSDAVLLNTDDWSTVGVLPHGAIVNDLAYSPDGRLLSASTPIAMVWSMFDSPEAMTAFALEAAPRCLTPAAREAAFLGGAAPDWCRSAGLWPYATGR